MEQVSGLDLAWFFQQWLFRPGSPVVEGNWKYNAKTKRVEIELAQKQTNGLYRLPLEIGVSTDGTGRANRKNRTRRNRISNSPSPPTWNLSSVVLDPNTWMLMTSKFTEAGGGTASADVVFTNGNIYTEYDKQPQRRGHRRQGRQNHLRRLQCRCLPL